ncbi:hypothetical protein OSB04_031862 [Centaurea solstitialis]|uniref:Reverse transcriptase domain-containing protein n=1 Tax=Centaurea solstitialis TaxID=347529 RepID=A0AA38S9T8_9ASTR|nr:hypothetical protein OSB04_031862 [Centaurea solstitialis]
MADTGAWSGTSRVSVFSRLSPSDSRLGLDSGECSYANAVGNGVSNKLTFYPPTSKADVRVALPVDMAKQAALKYNTTMYGYFLGPRLQFMTVKQAVTRAWGKYGLQDVMMNANGVYFFKFNDVGGCDHVIEQGPLFIRDAPLFSFKWDPSKGLSKPVHSMCPLWVKLHNIPLVAFNIEGIGRIASTIGVPKQMDAATASMCDKAWGRPGFAKVLIDTWAVGELKKEIDVVIPSLNGESDTIVKVRVEYVWEPSQCSHCLVFGHKRSGCVKAALEDSKKQKQKQVDSEGFTTVARKQWRPKVNTSVSTPVEPTLEKQNEEDSQGDDQLPVVDVEEENRVVQPESTSTNTIEPQQSDDQVSSPDNVEPKDVSTGSVPDPTVPPMISTVVDAMLPKPPLKSILKNTNRFSALSSDDRGGGGTAGKTVQGNISQRNRGPTGNVEGVRDLLVANGVSVCAIVESKVLANNLVQVCDSVFCNWSWVSNVAYCDAGTRIILAWDMRCVNIVIIESHAQYIHCLIRVKGIDDQFYATFVYGSNNTIARRELWSGLRKAKVLMNHQPWVLMGDFNAMLFQHDGYGGSSRRNMDMEEFFFCVEDVELYDVSYTGIQYTWSQKPMGDDGILRKLDRVLSNVEFTSMFTDAQVRFLPRGISDHSPGLLAFGGDVRKVVSGFRFDNFVTQHPCFSSVVEESWQTPVFGSFMYQLMYKLKALKKPLRQLRARYGDISKRVASLKTELDAIQVSVDLDPGNKELQEDLAHLYLAYHQAKADEEMYYRQRAKGNFVIGDGVGSTFLNHFQSILGTRDLGVDANIPPDRFTTSLSLTQSLDIIRPISDEEIKNAIFSIGNDKAPGSDGFSSKFFKASWEVVGKDVMVAVHNFFYSGRLLKEVNHTLLCLIPKCPNASRVGDYRPISCCSVIYKTISKIISDRIKPYLDHLVSKSQSAFIPGRRIADNILLAHELVAVDWTYVINLLHGFGFRPVLIAWIREMLHTSSFSLAINGESVGFFKGARGLRQGDPLSPYLFTLVMEGFNMALKQCIQQASTEFGFHAGCEDQGISHLCFADDLFVFTRGDVGSVDVLKRALEIFRQWSGMEPSLEKSEGFFANVSQDTKAVILDLLPFNAGVFPIRYLGVPLSPTRLKVGDYHGLVEKVTKRIHNWKVKSLSFAGRKLLISSVLQSMQLYWMSVFVLPSGVIHELEAMFRKFLWAQGDLAQGKCKLSWEVVCKPITNGGLGIRRLGTWNKAMVTKHLWDIISNRSTLWVQWIRAFVDSGPGLNHALIDRLETQRLLQWLLWIALFGRVDPPLFTDEYRVHVIICGTTHVGFSPTAEVVQRLHMWGFSPTVEPVTPCGSALAGCYIRPLVRRFFFHRIGNGEQVNAWMDTWLDCGSLSEVIPFRRFSNMGFTTMTSAREVILACGPMWPTTWSQISPNLHHCAVPMLSNTVPDVIYWKSINGALKPFSVGDAYRDFCGSLDNVGWAKEVWFKGCIPKHAFCVWTACYGRLPTQDRLHWKHDPPDLKCPLCNTVIDSHDHLFFLCCFSLEIWRTIKRDTRLWGFAECWKDICTDLIQGRGPRRKEQRLALQATVYCIWRERNRRLFGNRRSTVAAVIKEIRDVVLQRMAWVTFDDVPLL